MAKREVARVYLTMCTYVDEVLLALDKHPVLPAQLLQLQLHLVGVGLLLRPRPRRRLPVLDHPTLPPVATHRGRLQDG